MISVDRPAGPLVLLFSAAALLLSCGREATGGPGGGSASPRLEPAQGWFVDVTAEVGLDFVHETGAAGGLHLPEIMSGGLALRDFDVDGRLDIYLTNGSFVFGGGPEGAAPVNRLYRQLDDGTFADFTERSGLADAGYGLGVAVGDVDNDGDPDVYVGNFGPDRLYINLGDGRFEEAAEAAGIAVSGFSSSAVFCDYDRDGYLDLYVTQYVRYDPDQICKDSSGRRDYCTPKVFDAAPDVLLHNEGDGTFTDVSGSAGLQRVAGPGLGVVCEDLDDDGWPDFYVANDQAANHLWIHRDDGSFEERALLLGAAYNLEGRAEAGMGVVGADLDDDRDLDLFVTHLETESNTLYRNLGAGLFEDATGPAGLAEESLQYTGFGTAALDVELDGDLDLLVANGRVLRRSGGPLGTLPEPWSRYAEPNLFFLNRGGGRYEPRREPAFTDPVEVSRGLAVGDVDDDGDLDFLVVNAQSRARLYRNEAPRLGSWLTVRALDPRLGRDAIGARLTLVGDGRRLVRTVAAGFGYLSSHDPRAHFGLGPIERVERIEVRWPDGLTESFTLPGVDREVTLRRGGGSS